MKYLISLAAMLVLLSQTLSAGDTRPYSVRMMDSEMLRNPDATWLDGRQGKLKWNYTTGLELLSFLDVAERYGLQYPWDYVRNWADTMADENGNSIPDFQGQYFVAADNEYVDKLLGFLDSEVFPVFGEEFISQ